MPVGKCGKCKYHVVRDGDGYCNDTKQKEPDEPCGYHTLMSCFKPGKDPVAEKIRNKEW